MTTRAVVDSVLTVTRAAVSGSLLSDADSLAAGIGVANWVRSVRGGDWLFPDVPTWHLLPSDHAPNLAVFFSDEDVSTVVAAGQELVRRLDQEEGLLRHGPDPGWFDWLPSDQRWAEWDGLDADWLTWDGRLARVSLNVTPARQARRVRVLPNLHFQIERIDTPSEGLPVDNDRARRIARSGSPVARWYLAGQPVLPDDVVKMLRRDDDSAVVAAVEGGEARREMHASWDARHAPTDRPAGG